MADKFEGYETAAERLVRIHADHKEIGDLRIHARILEIVREPATLRPIQYICECQIFYGDVLMYVDVAEEMVGSSFVNKASALENASTSALGRALSLAGYLGTDPNSKKPSRPTRADMEKHDRFTSSEAVAVENPAPKQRVYTEAETTAASEWIEKVTDIVDTEELKKIWAEQAKLLDVPVGKDTLKAAINRQVKAGKDKA
jgi:hypothetical protein